MLNMTSRRAFLGGAVSYAAGAAARPGPNDTIHLALIGSGARGRGVHIPCFQKLPGTRFVAVCDVNEKYLAQGRTRAGGDQLAAYHDYRKLLEDKTIDAVIVGAVEAHGLRRRRQDEFSASF